MQTYSHLLITAVFNEKLKEKGVAVASKALLIGSIAPDVPLILITIGFIAYNQFITPIGVGDRLFLENYDQNYFTNPYWIASHNLLHAPLLLLLYGSIGFWRMKKGDRWGRALFWFAIGCGLHAILDIFTHVHDGPVLFFPFNWTYRFAAPVSYWDPDHGGNIFLPLEHLLDAGILIYLFVKWRRRKAVKVSVQ